MKKISMNWHKKNNGCNYELPNDVYTRNRQ